MTQSEKTGPRDAVIELTGNDLTLADLTAIAAGAPVKLGRAGSDAVDRSRAVVDDIVANNEVVYGVNTGFGNFASVVIPPEKLAELQYNLIRSHAAGVGPALDLANCRALMALRANVLAKGYSGIRRKNLEALIDALNAGFHPFIPEQGSVGASGDLAPLAHLTLNLLGEGEAFLDDRRVSAAEALEAKNLKPIDLEAKEGLAFINGTQVMAAIGGLALKEAASLARHADIIAALSLEALRGSRQAFYHKIHEARPHTGQKASADNLWRILAESEIMESHRDCGKVQDSYSLRCVPQVHGPARDTLDHVLKVFEIEINSATDNPMVLGDEGRLISGGNFHGESLAMAFDFSAIAVAELANISERRIERLCNPALSDLPAFLVQEGGLNSGFMIAHCTAAALVSENKSLCHPASVDSISTSAAKEDHVSMGTIAARQFRAVVTNVRRVLAIELLAASQGLNLIPEKPALALQGVVDLVRAEVAPWDRDRYMASDIQKAEALIGSGNMIAAVERVSGPLA
ncbi:histidine ammonia-lyase [Sulfidibacter corallicola]|uniref:Histidine ammonia-lyase n=1 Tax=Sulfidibacter corallicola TaxID=2818388 RepID=A0A8A4U2X2_SULCO|nr:histidine ammonia-lyase [Sulfidibacter corallicola]QTD53085.1 histidine ammonia-lyase [Sulfidibacter corallicola]